MLVCQPQFGDEITPEVNNRSSKILLLSSNFSRNWLVKEAAK